MKKGSPLMLICILLVVLLFVKFVFPAMEKGDKGPSSVLGVTSE